MGSPWPKCPSNSFDARISDDKRHRRIARNYVIEARERTIEGMLFVVFRKEDAMTSDLRVCAITVIVVSAIASSVHARTITIVSGTYGGNCGAPDGNATFDLTRQCDGRDTCQYMPDRTRISDATRVCRKDLQADWRCTDSEFHTAMLSPEAGVNSTLVLSCIEQDGPGH
jgi:hypothetical protein